MASGKQLMEQIYDQFLVCKICFEIYKRPKTLVCLHTFCIDCLIKHQDAEFERTYRYSIYNATVSCPICRKKTDLPTGGVRRLPDNFLVANLADVVTRRRPFSKYQECEICKADKYNLQRQAVSKCLDCAKHLCKVCVELHRQTKVTKSHSLFDIEIEKEIECKNHPDEIVRFYCEPCEQCICVVCTFQEHKGHEVSSFNEGMQKYQASLDKLVSLCRERIFHVKEQIGIISKCEGEIKNAEDQIRDTAIGSITDIRKKEREMVKNVYEAFGEEAMDFLKEKEPLQANLETLQSTCNLTDVVTRDKNVELLLIKDEIQEKINKLLEREVEAVPASLSKQIKFIPGTVDFGKLAVDGQICNGDKNDSLPAIEIGIHTDKIDYTNDQVSFTDQQTATDQSQCENKLTQTSRLQVHERGTSPVCSPVAKVRSRGVMTDKMRITTHEQETNTLQNATNKRKTQTVRIEMVDKGIETNLSDQQIDNKRIKTKFCKNCENNPPAKKNESKHATTDTIGLVVYKNKGNITPLCYVKTSSESTMTDDVTKNSAGTLTDKLPTAEKSFVTPKPALIDRCINTQKVASRDFGLMTQVKSSTKSVNTKAMVTCHTGSGDADVRSRDQSTITSQTISQEVTKVKSPKSVKDKRNKSMEPAAKKARLETSQSQTDIKLYDMDRLWDILNRTMSSASTSTDPTIVIKEKVATTDTGMITDPVQNNIEAVKSVDFRDSTTTMNSNVLKAPNTKGRNVTFSEVTINKESQPAMEIDDTVPLTTFESKIPLHSNITLTQSSLDNSIQNTTTKELTQNERSPKVVEAMDVSNVSLKSIQTGPDAVKFQTVDASTSTCHGVHVSNQDTNTPHKSYSEKNCGPTAPDTKDKKTSTFIERRNVAIMKRPHYISRGVITPKILTNEKTTTTEPKQTTDAISFTDAVSVSSTGSDPIVHPVDVKCVRAAHVSYQDSGASPDNIASEERASSPIRLPVMTNRGSSPIKTPVSSKAISAFPLCQERSVETIARSTRDTFTMTPAVKHAHRKTSPVREFKSSISQSTSTPRVACSTRALSPIRGFGRAKGTMTSQPCLINRGSSPVTIPGHDKVVMTTPSVKCQQTETEVKRTSDVCVSTLKIQVINKGTEMPTKHYSEKQTTTARIHSINKMVGTETTRCVDGFTTMATDIASAYKSVITPKPVRTCSRGTSTKAVHFATKETSPDRPYASDRGSSPIKFATFDKAITANKAQISEPRDMFQSVGMITLPFRPVADNPKSDLESIEELAESDEDHRNKEIQTDTSPWNPRQLIFGRRAISVPDIRPESLACRSGQAALSRLAAHGGGVFAAKMPRVGGTKTLSQSMFSFNRNDIKSVLQPIKMSTNTDTVLHVSEKDPLQASARKVETQDKCVCTESLQVGPEKMAECINKLKTVRQRLEQQPMYVQAPTTPSQGHLSSSAEQASNSSNLFHDSVKENRPVERQAIDAQSHNRVMLLNDLSRKDIDSKQSLKDTQVTTAESRRETTKKTNSGQRGSASKSKVHIDYPKAFLADKVDTTLTIRSRSVEKVPQQTTIAPFLTPQLSRKIITTESSDDTDRDESSAKRTLLARKSRPPIEQLLGRSASLPEQPNPVYTTSLQPHSKSLNLPIKLTSAQNDQSLKSPSLRKLSQASSVGNVRQSIEDAIGKRTTHARRPNVPLPDSKQTALKQSREKKTKTEALRKPTGSRHFLEPTVASRAASVQKSYQTKPLIGGRGRALLRTAIVKDIETSSESSN